MKRFIPPARDPSSEPPLPPSSLSSSLLAVGRNEGRRELPEAPGLFLRDRTSLRCDAGFPLVVRPAGLLRSSRSRRLPARPQSESASALEPLSPVRDSPGQLGESMVASRYALEPFAADPVLREEERLVPSRHIRESDQRRLFLCPQLDASLPGRNVRKFEGTSRRRVDRRCRPSGDRPIESRLENLVVGLAQRLQRLHLRDPGRLPRILRVATLRAGGSESRRNRRGSLQRLQHDGCRRSTERAHARGERYLLP